ncbi:anti-sigma factor [Ancylomarina sp. 16SWW S1-10-2]|uniref:anti-sigma factor family protein n=1 Tax=Ancylomarina sp. 16SWW S1-10-2 TaxID=2499681 RepID=UPI0012ADABC3|nr:hypothetical protein [Ancylomarina sp. 16SWW S1-10-2]MRT92302.1 hypothetical protein [Ancylomarina sp. 16SWW S1-10-2]
MKVITRNNYEEFFLDYIEGEISATDKVALESFLAENPDLKKELDEMMDMNIECEGITISVESDSLKDIPFQENLDDFCIAKIEGDLDTYENKAFDYYIASNPNKQKELSLYQKTKLEADQSIIFKEKKSLRRRNKGLILIRFAYTSLAAAASIALLFTIWTNEIKNKPSDLNIEQISQNTRQTIASPDSTKNKIQKNISTEKDSVNTKALEKQDKTSKTKIKGKIQHKSIIKTDALPNRAAISNKESIDKIVVKQLLVDNKRLAIENINLPKAKLDGINNINTTYKENTGLASLGLTWKSSQGDDKNKEKSTLLKIASYGVSQIGKFAGKKINLEKKYDPKTDKTRVAFNTLGIGFSTPTK